MHRVLWLRVGSSRLHLLKLAGAFIMLAAMLKVFESVYALFLTVNKAIQAQAGAQQALALFDGCMQCWGVYPVGFTNEDFLGVVLGPVAAFLFWLAVVVIGLMVYQSGRVLLPIEEYDIAQRRAAQSKRHALRRKR